MPGKHLLLIGILVGVGLASGRPTRLTPSRQSRDAQLVAPKIGVVDLNQCFSGTRYERARDEQSKYMDLVSKFETELQEAKRRVKKTQDEIDRSKPSQEVLNRLREELKRFVVERDSLLEKFKDKAEAEHVRIKIELYTDILNAINDYAKANGFDLIIKADNRSLTSSRRRRIDDYPEEGQTPDDVSKRINHKALLYYEGSMDITDKVIEKLNKEYRRNK